MVNIAQYFIHSKHVIAIINDNSADQLSRFRLDSQGIDHKVKGKMKNMVISRNIHKKNMIVME